MKRSHVLAQQLGRVALGIHGDEDHLQLSSLRTQLLHHRGGAGQRGGADVGALYETEVQHHDLALEVAKAARLPVEIGQLEAARVVCTRDVDAFEG